LKFLTSTCRAALFATVTLGEGTLSANAAEGAYDTALRLDPAAYETLSITLNGAPIAVRRYEAVYVGAPIEMAENQPARSMGPGGSPASATEQALADPLTYQKLAVYVPETAFDDQTTAMIFAVNNAGWFASELRESITDGGSYSSDSDTDKVGAALAAGYVFVDVGTRGRGIIAADGSNPGKAPAAIVDAKAAIRFLRLNDDILPGSAERIVITGTSGGGGLSAMVAASGNSADFFPALAAIGAAGMNDDGQSTLRDNVFATIAYCPITSLGFADLAYEWQYQDQRGRISSNTDAELAASETLRAAYPDYLAELDLTTPSGEALTPETMRAELLSIVTQEVQDRIDEGGDIPALGENFVFANRGQTTEVENTWLDVQDGVIAPIDLEKYLDFVATTTELKVIPAFDQTANTGHESIDGENTLFGSPELSYSNFTAYGWDHNAVAGDGSGSDDTGMDWVTYIASEQGQTLAAQIRMVDPQAYLKGEADTAPYWYIRHGMIDRDTSFAVEIALYNAVRMTPSVQEVNFTLPWMTPHSGDYDVQEAYAWLAGVLAEADTK
jgi:hypothetical protein